MDEYCEDGCERVRVRACMREQCACLSPCNSEIPNSEMNVCLDANVMPFYLVTDSFHSFNF